MRTELRCRACCALLATRDAAGITIRRGGIRVTVTSGAQLTIVCYHCSKSHTLTISPDHDARLEEDVGDKQGSR